MAILQRVFLPWRRPAVVAVAERMLTWAHREPDVFRRSLVLAPTRESCRRLREELGRAAGALLTPRLLPAGQLLVPEANNAAPAAVELAAWVETIAALRNKLPALFPRASSWNDENLLDVAARMQELAGDLLLHGWEPGEVAARAEGGERERWRDVALVLATWERLVAGAGFVDSFEAARRERLAPSRLAGVRGRVVLACVPGVTAPVREALERSGVPVEVWIHAPEELAATFDDWGTPTDAWLEERIALDEERVMAADNAAHLAELACDALAAPQEKGEASALGLADASLFAPLAHELRQRGADLFRPDGEPFAGTGWMTLLRALEDEAESPGYASPLLRLARMTQAACGLGIRNHEFFCRELSELEQLYFPETAESVRALLEGSARRWAARRTGETVALPDESEENRQRALLAAWDALVRWATRATSTGNALLAGLAEWAQECLSSLSDALPEGWREGAEFVLREVRALQAYPGLKPGIVLGLLKNRLANARFVSRRAPNAVFDASGWMEMLYAPEAHVVLAGMTEGCVPEAPRDDALLTENLRRTLGMEHAGSKTARDSYLLTDIVESRREAGSVHLLYARVSKEGDPLAPSSLLFRCRDEELPARVLRLFGPPARPAQALPRDLGAWGLEERAAAWRDAAPETEVESLLPGFVNPWKESGKGFSPSRLNAFWACPMRFWLAEAWRLRGDEPVVNKATFDAREVGNVLHEALRNFAARFPSASSLAGVGGGELETAMDGFLHAALGAAAERLFMPAAMQRRNMRRRLHAYARLHREELLKGWECALFEHPVGGAGEAWTWGGFPMEFRLDRLDVLRDADGRVLRVRVVDYKTGSPEHCMQGGRPSPAAKCLRKAGREEALRRWFPGLSFLPSGAKASPQRWVDLQMPVYAAWAAEWAAARYGLPPEAVEPWYCFLPADPWKTCMAAWEGFHEKQSVDGDAAGISPAESGRLWACAAMGTIARGAGFVSAEQLGWESPPYDRLAEAFGYAPDLGLQPGRDNAKGGREG